MSIFDLTENTGPASTARVPIQNSSTGTTDSVQLANLRQGTHPGSTSTTDNALARYNGTAGDLQNSGGYMLDDNNMSLPNQTSFLAQSATEQTNVTGDGTAVTLVLGTEIYDQNADFDGTSTFTAPITGKYILAAGAGCQGILAEHTGLRLRIVTSNRNYEFLVNPTATREAQIHGTPPANLAVLADMDASDTATANVTVGTGATSKVVDIELGIWTYFSGHLLG